MANLRPAMMMSGAMLTSLCLNHPVHEGAISGYLRLLERKSRFDGQAPQVWAFEADLFRVWKKEGYAAMGDRLPVTDPFMFDTLLFPVSLPYPGQSDRWVLFVIRPKPKIIRTYDPQQRPRPGAIKLVLEFLRLLANSWGMPWDEGAWNLLSTPVEAPKPKDTTSSGLFLLAFAEAATRGITVRGLEINQLEMRRRIARALRVQRLRAERFELLEASLLSDSGVRFGGSGGRRVRLMKLTVSTGGPPQIKEVPEDPVSFRLYGRYGTAPVFLKASTDETVKVPLPYIRTIEPLPFWLPKEVEAYHLSASQKSPRKKRRGSLRPRAKRLRLDGTLRRINIRKSEYRE